MQQPPPYVPPDAAPSRSNRAPALVVVVAVVAVALVAVVAWVVFSGDDDAGASVRLEAATDVGSDPFTESVQIGPAVEFPGNVAAVNDSVRADLVVDDGSATLIAPGSTPGLYGGSGEVAVCDPDALVEFLDAAPRKARAWASAAGIDPDGIAEFVAALTPAVLTSDTYVTNHGFRDGRATSFPAVLQAGTAVLVDASGMPRVKCNCGNPLGAPPTTSLRGATTTGTQWSGFAVGSVVTVRSAPSTGTLTFTDLTTGEPVDVTVGGGGGGRWVAAVYGDSGTALHVSSDGTAWDHAGSVDRTQMHSLVWDGGRWVAIGTRFGERNNPTRVFTSVDLRTWTDLGTIPAAVDDIAWGDGRFVAVGTGAFGSADGATWTPIEVAGPPDLGPGRFNAVARTAEGWVASHVYSEFSDGGVRHLLVSPDGIAPFDEVAGAEPVLVGAGDRAAMAASDEWLAVAGQRTLIPDPAGENLEAGLQIGENVASLADVPISVFNRTPADALAWGAPGWLAATWGGFDLPNGDSGEPWRTTFFASDDAQDWFEAGSLDGQVTAVAWGGGGETAPSSDPATGGDLRGVDWRNRSYRLDDCPDGGVEKLFVGVGSWTSVDGAWGVAIADVVHGDLTGDGTDDALVHFECYAVGGNAFPMQVSLAFTGAPGGPSQIGGAIPGGAPVIEDGAVRTTDPVYAAGDPRCCPSGTKVTVWRLVGGEWVGS